MFIVSFFFNFPCGILDEVLLDCIVSYFVRAITHILATTNILSTVKLIFSGHYYANGSINKNRQNMRLRSTDKNSVTQ